MKPYKLFLLSGLYMLLACVCFNAQGGSAINAQGVKGQTADINNRGSGGGVQDNMCKGKKAGDKCSAPGSKEAKCEPIRIHAKDKNTVLSCVVKSCQIDKGYLLELDNKTGRSKGICRTLKFGESQCAKSTNKPTCGTGQKLLPNPIANPNYPERDPVGAYKDCFCADTNKVAYECGEGTTGNPPTDDTPVTNKQSVTVKDSGTCTKAGFSFKNWLCGKERKNTGDVFYIEEHVTCIAQWTEDKKCPSGTSGQHPKCVCDDTDKIYNEQTQKCEYPTDKPANSEGICVAPVKKACPNDASGTYPDCMCTDEDKKYNKDANTCVCSDGKIEQDGKCITPTQCPGDASGTYPNCTCKDTEKTYDNGTNTCQCPNGTTEQDGKCVVPTKCPDDASGTYPDCTCKDKDKKYNKDKHKCECPTDKPANSDDVCVATVQKECPSDAIGNYPNCTCKDEDKKY